MHNRQDFTRCSEIKSSAHGKLDNIPITLRSRGPGSKLSDVKTNYKLTHFLNYLSGLKSAIKSVDKLLIVAFKLPFVKK